MSPADLPTIRNQPLSPVCPPSAEDTADIHLTRTPGPVATPAPNNLPRVRGYLIQSFVGSGGMGVVYKARHIDLQRTVALKMLHETAASDGDAHERFQAEAEAVARVQHPNIIQVFEIGIVQPKAGEQRPRPFISLEFMDGGCLTRLTESPQAPAFAARMVEKLARAAHAAHSLGVVHRDLKPANVLLTKEGEPKIADFGVAKLSGQQERSLTQAGMTVGTPEYMAPEQAGGEDSGPAADIYSLGVILYQLLTARLPFHGSNPMDTMYLVRNEEPVSPRHYQPRLPRDLDTICLKCLAKKPGRRYESAAALADDLNRWAEGRTICARPVGRIERSCLWVRRNPVVAALSVAIVLVGLIGMAGVVSNWRKAEERAEMALRSEHYAQVQAEIARQEKAAGEWGVYRAHIMSASNAMQVFNPRMARRALDSVPQPLRKYWEWRHFDRQLDTSHTVMTDPGTKPVYWINQSPHGTRNVTVDEAETARVYDTATHSLISVFPNQRQTVNSEFVPNTDDLLFVPADTEGKRLIFRDVFNKKPDREFVRFDQGIANHRCDPNGERVYVITGDGMMHVLELATGRVLHSWRPHERGVITLSFSKDGSKIATVGGTDRTAKVWDAKTYQCLHTLNANHTWHADSATFSPDGDRLLVASWYPGNKLWLWNLKENRFVKEMALHTNQIKWHDFSPDGSRIVSVSLDQSVAFWDGHTGNLLNTQRQHRGWVVDADFSPDGKWLVTCSHDRSLRLWNYERGESVACLFGHDEDVLNVCFTADSKTIVSGSRDGTVRLWSVSDAIDDSRLRGHTNFVYGVAFHPDGERIASASWDGTAKLWNATTGRELRTYSCGKTITSHVAIHPDGKQLATLSRDSSVRLWDVDSGELLHVWNIPNSSWQDARVAFSPDGKWLAACDDQFSIRILDVAKRAEAAELKGHISRSRDLVFSPDGRWLATASEEEDRTVRIWDTTNWTCAHTLKGHAHRIYSLAFNRDGTLLASGSTDGSVLMWNTATWKRQGDPLLHGSAVYSLVFTASGERLVSGCADNTIRLWDVERQQEMAELNGHDDYVHSLAFSPDGTRLVSGSGDKTIRVWDTKSLRERKNGVTPNRP